MTQNVRILPNFILRRSFKWWNISILSQIFDTNQNFLILPSFTLPEWSKNKKKSFQHKSKSGFCNFSSFACLLVKSVNFGQKCQFWAKFSRRLKISGFIAKFHLSQVPSGQNLNLSQIFTATENFWFLLHFILPMFSERSKMSVLSQIFNTTENFRILPNFILCRSKMSTLREPN